MTFMKIGWRDIRLAAPIVAVNLIPAAGVIFLGWKVLALLLLFWLETILIVVYGAIHLILLPGSRDLSWFQKLLDTLGVTIFASVFGAVLLWGIMGIAGLKELKQLVTTGNVFHDLGLLMDSERLWVPFGMLAVVHAAREIHAYRTRSLEDAIVAPIFGIIRFFTMSFLLLLFAMPIMLLDSPFWGLSALVVAKVALEVGARQIFSR
jgi:hypothetical protein